MSSSGRFLETSAGIFFFPLSRFTSHAINHPYIALLPTCHFASHRNHPTQLWHCKTPPIASNSDFLLPSHLLQTFPMDPLSPSETSTTPRQRGDEQGLGGFPLMKKLNERLRNFRIPLVGESHTKRYRNCFLI